MLDQSKVKLYYTKAYSPSSDTLPLKCNTFLLLCPLMTVYFRNYLVTNCFYKDKFKNRFIAQKQWIFLFIHIFCILNDFYYLVLQPRENAKIFRF
jgi:hypothetical protein